jgi:hypothetical protein
MAKFDPLDARFDDPVVQRRVLDKLKQIRSEHMHVLTAAGSLESDINARRKHTDPVVGTSTMELRNWVMSLVESVAYIEWQIGVLSAVTVFDDLLGRMWQDGAKDALVEGMEDAWTAAHRSK